MHAQDMRFPFIETQKGCNASCAAPYSNPQLQSVTFRQPQQIVTRPGHLAPSRQSHKKGGPIAQRTGLKGNPRSKRRNHTTIYE